MSRTGLHRPRRTRAVHPRPAPGTRLLFTLFPPHILHPNTHYKRCPKALRLGLRSDLSPSRPTHGRSPDKSRHAPLEGNCQVSAPLIGRNGIAPSGDAQEHGVKLLHRALAPFSDSPGVTIGMFRSTNAGRGSTLPSLRVVEHFRWARLPQSENISRLVHTLSEVWGKDSTVVTTGELPTTNAGHGSTLPSLRVVEHFRWARLPQSESFSRLVHTLSEVWGCRRVDADENRPQGRTPRIGTGVADILHKPSGTFHPLPTTPTFRTLIPAPSTSVIPDSDRESIPRGWGSARPEWSRRVSRAERVGAPPRCGAARAEALEVRAGGGPRTANRPPMPSHTAPFILSFRCPARNLGWGGGASHVPPTGPVCPPIRHPSHCHSDAPRGIWGGASLPRPTRNPQKSLQASFNQNSYEFNQCSINVQSKTRPPQLNKNPQHL